MMFFIVDPAHARTIATLIVYQNESLCASLADVAKDVGLTTYNVNIASPFIQMVESSALKASAFVF
jgi:hypothetical protein